MPACRFLLALAIAALALPARAQESAAPPAAVTIDDIARQRQAAANDVSLDEAGRAAAAASYDEAEKQVRAGADWDAKAAEQNALRDRAPADAEALDRELAAPPDAPPPVLPDTASSLEIEAQTKLVDAERAAAVQQLSELLAQPAQRVQERARLRELLAGVRRSLGDAAQQAGAPPAPGEAPQVAQARQTAAQARVQALQAEARAYEATLQSYDARSGLLNKNVDAVRRRIRGIERRLGELRMQASQRRGLEARQAAEAAQKVVAEVAGMATEAAPAIETLAKDNAALAAGRGGMEGIGGKLTRLDADLEEARAETARLKTAEASLRERVAAGVFNDTLGQLLLKLRTELPGIDALERRIAGRDALRAQAELDAIVSREDRQSLGDLDQRVEEVMAGLSADRTPEQRRRVENTLRTLHENNRALRDDTLRDQERLASKLEDVREAESELLAQTRSLSAFIDENILWIRGEPLWGLAPVESLWAAARWIAATAERPTFAGIVAGDLWANAPLYVMAVSMLVLAAAGGQRLRRALHGAAARAQRQWHTRFGETLEALAITVALAAIPALAIGFFAWRLDRIAAVGPWGAAAAGGLEAVAWWSFSFALAIGVLGPHGLATAHFAWSREAAARGRRWLRAVALVLLPAVFVLVTLGSQQIEETWALPAGRIAFILALSIIAGGCARAWALYVRAAADPQQTAHRPVAPRTRWLGYALFAGFPALLAIVAMLGYYHAAQFLAERFTRTLLAGLIAALAIGLARRWLLLARRRIALVQMQRARGAETDGGGEAAIDLERVDEQAERLVRAVALMGLALMAYIVWSDAIPVAAGLEKIALWPSSLAVDAPAAADGAADADGGVAASLRTAVQYVTAADALRAVIIAAIALFAARNVPLLIELLLVQRLRIGSGERFAILALTRYALAAAGILAVAAALGIRWSSVQWLVAALGVGLGFGLQEIFANLVSGIILLFERPIRVGDIVTVGEVTGTVNDIRIRATTITDWDRKELVVPNKEIVTGRLINWTLDDRTLRIVLRVGVAYGSDLRRVQRVFAETVRADPKVLADPEPQIVVQEFGDSAINVELRVFVDVDDMWRARNDLNMALAEACRAHGIEIAFPQRDLHIRSGLEALAPRPPA